ncbi:hypothetical protein [Paenibacillus sp. URB8-2]|nr:hypothetical protein [Paenibacillus sp. URB8-2]
MCIASEEGKQDYRDYNSFLEEMNAAGVEYVRGHPGGEDFRRDSQILPDL